MAGKSGVTSTNEVIWESSQAGWGGKRTSCSALQESPGKEAGETHSIPASGMTCPSRDPPAWWGAEGTNLGFMPRAQP